MAMQNSTHTETTTFPTLATLGGGCFWCLEAVYNELQGVEQVVSGYAGGTVPNPTYYQVCEGDSGHAEVVQLTFDRHAISVGHFLPQSGPARDCGGTSSRGDRSPDLGCADCDGSHAPRDFLSGGGLPPGVLSAQSCAALLPVRDCTESRESAESVF